MHITPTISNIYCILLKLAAVYCNLDANLFFSVIIRGFMSDMYPVWKYSIYLLFMIPKVI